MAKLPYRFFINPFLVATQNSYKLMLSIGEDHKARLLNLQADAEIADILATYDPILQAYKTADQNLQSAEGTYEGKTQTVEELFEKLNSEKLPYWEGQIHSVYYKGTPAEKAFFPDSRKPFHNGTYEQRISSIKVLGERCALDASAVVVAVSVNILAFHTQIEGARVLQQSQGEGAVAALRNLRETARVLLCEELYGDMGLLMHKHRAKPLDIDQYFEMKYLRSAGDSAVPYTIAPDEVKNIMNDVEAGDVTGTKIKNTSDEDVTLQIYFAASPSEPPSDTTLTLHQSETKVLDEATLGTLQPFLNVVNTSSHLGTFEVTAN